MMFSNILSPVTRLLHVTLGIGSPQGFPPPLSKPEGIVRLHLAAVGDKEERQILVLRYGLVDTPLQAQCEVAEKPRISRSYVSRIEKAILEKPQEV